MSFFCSSCSYIWSRTYFEGTSCTCPFCGKYLLHDALCYYSKIITIEAIEKKVSDNVILALIEANKDAVNKLDSYGRLPLRTAVDNGCSDEVILALLEANQDAVNKVGRDGDLPLHTAIENKCSDAVILALLEANQDAASKASSSNNLPLHMAIEFKLCDKIIVALLNANTKAAFTENGKKKLPLFLAIELNHNEEIISALLAAYTDGAWEKIYNYYSKIRPSLMYSAIEGHYSDDILAQLLVSVFKIKCYGQDEARNDALSNIIQGNREQVVLHAAAILSDHERFDMLCRIIECTSSESVLLFLVLGYPEINTNTMSYGDGPVNRAITCKRSDEVILTLLEANKNYARPYNIHDIFPLHNAMKQKRSDEVILALLASNPDAAAKFNLNNHYPLHSAIMAKCTDAVVLALLSAHPEAACDRSATRLMPVLVRHALKKNYSDAVIVSLLNAVVENSDLTEGYHYMLKDVVQAKGEELVLQAAESLSDDATKNMMLLNLIKTVQLDTLVIAMVSRFPETLQIRGADGNLALHIALEWKRSEEVVLAIFNGYKAAVKEDSAKCDLPLHQAIRKKYSEKVVLALLKAYKKASQEFSANCDLPLHQAIRNKYSEKVVLAMLKAYKKALQEESGEGELPLHMAIAYDFSDHVVMKMLSAYPCAAMIRCKKSRMLPLHLAAASSASPRLVESLISQYPEALQITVNNMTPSDLVTSALPMESIKLICRPSLHKNEMCPTRNAEKVGSTESLKQVSMEVAKMAKLFEGLCSNILELNLNVGAVKKRLEEHSTKPNDHVPLDVSSLSVCESKSTAGDSDPLGLPVVFESLITKVSEKKKKNRIKKKTREEVKENNNGPMELTEPQSLATTVAGLSDLWCNAATTVKTNSAAAPKQSETLEQSGPLESREEPLQLQIERNYLLIPESLLRSQTFAAKCSATKVTDVCASKLSDVKVDFDEVPPASEVNSKLFFSAESSECDIIVSEPNLLDASSNGSNTANFNSYVTVGKHIREESLEAPELVDNVKMEHNPKTDNLDEVESCTFIEKVSSKSSLSGSSDGSFSFVDDGMSNKDKGESVNHNDDIISIKSSVG